MKISEIITDRYKLRIPPTVYYELLADVLEAEEKQEPTTKNDLGVDCIKKSDAINIIQDMHGLARADVISDAVNRIITMPSVTPQEPKTGHWVNGEYCSECGCDVPAYIIDWKWQKDMDAKYCPNCGCHMVEPQESEE